MPYLGYKKDSFRKIMVRLFDRSGFTVMQRHDRVGGGELSGLLQVSRDLLSRTSVGSLWMVCAFLFSLSVCCLPLRSAVYVLICGVFSWVY